MKKRMWREKPVVIWIKQGRKIIAVVLVQWHGQGEKIVVLVVIAVVIMTMVMAARGRADRRARADRAGYANDGRRTRLAIMVKQVVVVMVAVAVVLKRMMMNQEFYSGVEIRIRTLTGFAHVGESEIGCKKDATADKAYTGRWRARKAWTACAHVKAM